MVELLVVIGIIALLISILLPSLSKARKAANAVKCMANLRSVLQGAFIYWADNQNYIAGPNTSGLSLTAGGSYEGLPSSPVQNFDWASPIVGDSMNFPTDPLEKFEQIANSKLRCPEIETKYTVQFKGSPLPHGNPLLFSYVTPIFFHLLPVGAPANTEKDTGNEAITVASGYAPKTSSVGPAAQKVFLFEGARYWNGSGFDYSTVTLTTGLTGTPQGNFASRGPGFKTLSSGEPYFLDANGKPNGVYNNVALRHSGKMSVGFFDGHVVQMDYMEVRDISLWVPSGSLVKTPSALFPNPDGSLHTSGEAIQ